MIIPPDRCLEKQNTLKSLSSSRGINLNIRDNALVRSIKNLEETKEVLSPAVKTGIQVKKVRKRL